VAGFLRLGSVLATTERIQPTDMTTVLLPHLPTIFQSFPSRNGRAIQYVSNPPSMKKSHNHDGDEMKCKLEEFKRKF